ncbi:ABC-type multidrug transport system, ATPase and permease component [Anaerosporobacter mobilis DSM 15930]|uniref:ABC-type multidrug transport system, ATPase and permease component n=1 Tax=Anaerosporobacter mobilis DSM 15930 TaxID=1120996 RepID=A0A1M7MJS5_9FIRM|nr:ABC transporter ATP-binding protein [Anaerosporobacter mobilis]SHM90674.1 ABC-type multidrug transport system, ATPase and permease component [Anaerosporobacter mobilis DSM 15930]
MKELLWNKRGKFVQYLFASFLFIIDHFVQIITFSVILGVIEQGADADLNKIIWIAILAGVYNVVNFIISRMLRIGFMRDIILEVRKQAFDKIMRMSFKQFSRKSKDVYLSNLVNDINTFEESFFVSLLNFLINTGMFILSFIALLFLEPVLAGYMVIASAILYVISHFFSKNTVTLQEEVSLQNEIFTTNINNTFQGLEILKLNRMDDKFLHKSLDGLRKLELRKYIFNIFAECQKNLINVIGYVISCFLMLYLCLNFDKGMTLTNAAIVFQLGAMMSFNLIEAFPLWNKVKASSKIYEKITKDDEEDNDSVDDSDNEKTEEFTINQQIEVRDVSFNYGDKEILHHANFVIEKGKKYLIKGVSGAGKSTLINLLSMTYDNYDGQILADGVDYKKIKERTFHDKVSFIYQNVFLFEDTIRNNITLYKEIPDNLIQKAVEACDLSELISSQEHGLDQVLKENGKNLSGGQRQRISIARAIAKDSEILFVDEGTSSLNEELGREIEKVFLSLPQTVVAISHRYYEGISEQYDYVLEIKNGEVLQSVAADYFGEVVTC